jgi:hypothetical protein
MSLRPYEELAHVAEVGSLSPRLDDVPFLKTIIAYVSPAMFKYIAVPFILLMILWVFLLSALTFSGSGGFPVMLFCGFIIGPIGIGAVLVSGFAYVMSTLFLPPELLITDVVLRRGQSFDIQYKQAFKRKVTLNRQTYTLLMRESATYQEGTNTVTKHYDNVYDEHTERDVVLDANMPIDEQLTFTVPSDAMHTFDAQRNKLRWILKVKLDIPDFPDFHREYILKVIPEVSDES